MTFSAQQAIALAEQLESIDASKPTSYVREAAKVLREAVQQLQYEREHSAMLSETNTRLCMEQQERDSFLAKVRGDYTEAKRARDSALAELAEARATIEQLRAEQDARERQWRSGLRKSWSRERTDLVRAASKLSKKLDSATDQLATLQAENERMRPVVLEAGIYCSVYGDDSCRLDAAVSKYFGMPVEDTEFTIEVINATMNPPPASERK